MLKICIVISIVLVRAKAGSHRYDSIAIVFRTFMDGSKLYIRPGRENLQTRHKRQITDDPGPVGFRGMLDGQLIVDDSDPAEIQGAITGKLNAVKISTPILKITDSSDSLVVKGTFSGRIIVDDNDPLPGEIMAKLDLDVKLNTIVDDTEPVGISGHFKGIFETYLGEKELLAIVKDTDSNNFCGELLGELSLSQIL